MQTTKYTPEQTTTALEAYAQGATAEQIAQQLQKSTRSVVAKLVKEGVYQKPAAAPTRTRKLDLVHELAAMLDIDPTQLESLEKAQHSALLAVVEKLKQV